MTQTQEQQKVAEWMIGFGYLPKTSVHFSRFENGEEHIIDKKTENIVYTIEKDTNDSLFTVVLSLTILPWITMLLYQFL